MLHSFGGCKNQILRTSLFLNHHITLDYTIILKFCQGIIRGRYKKSFFGLNQFYNQILKELNRNYFHVSLSTKPSRARCAPFSKWGNRAFFFIAEKEAKKNALDQSPEGLRSNGRRKKRPPVASPTLACSVRHRWSCRSSGAGPGLSA